MSDRPTPETDAACNEVYARGVAHIPLVGFMERLERERDEALEEKLEQARLLGMSGSREAQLIRERDEAREQRDKAVNDYESAALLASRMQEQRDRMVEALREIEWCNDSVWQSDRAKAALTAVEGGEQ